jgi:hypothetical protein
MLSLSYYISTEIFNLTGTVSRIVAALTCTTLLSVFVLVIGAVVNWFESFQMRMLRKFFKRKTVIFICNYLTFVGTVLHELAHAFTAWAMGAKITEIRVLEIRDDGRLGHVGFKPTGSKTKQKLQCTFVSCAPVISGMILIWLIFRSIRSGFMSPLWQVISWYYIISIADHMSMSSADRKLYFKGLTRVFPVTFFISWGLIYFFMSH